MCRVPDCPRAAARGSLFCPDHQDPAERDQVKLAERRNLVNGRNLVGILEHTVHVDRALFAVRWSDWGWAVVRPAGKARTEGQIRVQKFRAKSGTWTRRLTVPLEDLLKRDALLELPEKDLKRLLQTARKALRNW